MVYEEQTEGRAGDGGGGGGGGGERRGQVSGEVWGDGATEENNAEGGDEVHPRVLRLGKPPSNNGRDDQESRNQCRACGP